MNKDCLLPWIEFFKTALDRPIPIEMDLHYDATDLHVLEQANKHMIWKLKGIAAKITYRLHLLYGVPSKLIKIPHDENQ